MCQVSRRALPGCLTIRQVIDVLSRTWHFVSLSLSLSLSLRMSKNSAMCPPCHEEGPTPGLALEGAMTRCQWELSPGPVSSLALRASKRAAVAVIFSPLYLRHRRVKMFFVRRLPGSGARLGTDTRNEAPGPAIQRPSWSGLITLITRTRPDAKNDPRNKLRIFSNSQFCTFLFSELNLGLDDPWSLPDTTCKLPQSFWMIKTYIRFISELFFSVACWHYWHWHLMLDHLPLQRPRIQHSSNNRTGDITAASASMPRSLKFNYPF